jgi:hypothetical protein
LRVFAHSCVIAKLSLLIEISQSACRQEKSAHNGLVTEIFKASRWTRGNFLFPTHIEVSDKSITRRKRSWFRIDEMSIGISKVASVHVKTGLIWSDILIESSGGTDPFTSHGHSKADAIRIKELIENAQAQNMPNPGS